MPRLFITFLTCLGLRFTIYGNHLNAGVVLKTLEINHLLARVLLGKKEPA